MASPSSAMKTKNSTVRWSAGLVALLALVLGYLYTSNPLLSGNAFHQNACDDSQFTCISQNDVLDVVLKPYEEFFPTTHGKHNELIAYKNHCLRVLSFAVHHFLNNTAYGNDPWVIDLMAMALAYHDLALWVTYNETEGSLQRVGRLDYLDPSVRLLKWDQEVLRSSKNSDETFESPLPILTEEDLTLATEMILQHHKVTPWVAPEGQGRPKMEALVNAIRGADWADATMGVVRFGGLSLDYMAYVYRQLPDAGFHETLGLMIPRLSPASWWDQLKILRILKW